MIKIHSRPETIGFAINDGGNPELLGIDNSSGLMVAIEVDSGYWKAFLENAQRLQVGIPPLVKGTVQDLRDLDTAAREAGLNGG